MRLWPDIHEADHFLSATTAASCFFWFVEVELVANQFEAYPENSGSARFVRS